eukprot:275784-Pleurochrysis_carterae.AAC.1
MRARLERAAAPTTWSAVRTSWGDVTSLASGSPGGCEGMAGWGGMPAALTGTAGEFDQGKHVSSKYTSE